MDSKLPNIALMKISAYYKKQGAEVEFIQYGGKYDKIYASCVFTKNKKECLKIQKCYKDAKIGGTGWDIKSELPCDIENMNPDYSLYGIDYGIGFTTRGCPNKCAFCIVPKKEGLLKQYREIKDIINPKSNKLILLDNNFTEDPLMIEKCKEIKDRNLIVDLCQGVNIRVMTEEKAYWLSQIKHMKQLRIAWDNIKDEKRVMDGLNILSKYMNLRNVMCYVLTGFNTTLEEDLYRINKLQSMNIDPYVMVYNDKDDKVLKLLEMWCNQPWLRKKIKFEEYDRYKRYKSMEGQMQLII